MAGAGQLRRGTTSLQPATKTESLSCPGPLPLAARYKLASTTVARAFTSEDMAVSDRGVMGAKSGDGRGDLVL
jgi:hypothetical protein